MKRKKRNPNQKVSLSIREITKMKERSTKKSIEVVRMFSLMILKDKYNFDQSDQVEFINYFNEMLDSYNRGYISLEDIHKVISEEDKLDLVD